ncbi:MAG TPA: sugar diacid recognition domain-containing protein, partial [Clostridia bacterium]|nr:sugar diacid recognition domain-containing protein [Clostridia bacterium]
MLNKVFQNLVYQVEEIVQNEFGITDNSGIIIACTDESKIGQEVSIAANFIKNDENSKVIEGFSFEKVFYKG